MSKKIIITTIFILFILSSCGKKSYVVFDYNCNGQDYHKCELKNNKLNCVIVNPVCGEYNFTGWYKANEYKNQVDLNGTFNANEIIYARWEKNGQVIESSSQELVSTIITPDVIDTPSSSVVEEPSSSKIEYSSQIIEEPSSQKPTPIPETTYTISFNLNGGTGGQSQSISGVKYGANLPSINQTKPTKAGYTFLGWYDSKEGGTQYYNSSNSPVKKYDKKSNITLYAHFNACPKGQYAASGATSCSACTGNTYTSTTGQSKCSTCATGYKANSDHTGCTANVLSIQYNGNGGKWNNPSNDTYGVNESGTVILKSTGQVYSQKVNYGKSLESSGLIDYNGAWLNWKKDEYIVESQKEYIIGTTVLDQAKVYTAVELANAGGCDLSKNNCTVTAKVNWKKESKPKEDKITDYVNISLVNRKIASAVKSKGYYTRAAVVNVATTTVNELKNSNYHIYYQLGGMYHRGNRWGLNPEWGTVIRHNDKWVLSGLDCRNFVIWAFKQAGLSLIRGFGSEGSMTKNTSNAYSDFTAGRPGDVIDAAEHIMLIVSNNGDGYTVAQSQGGKGVILTTYKYSDLQPQVVSSGKIWYKAYNMDGVYNDTGYWCDDPDPSKAAYRPYAGSCHIPKSEFPSYYN